MAQAGSATIGELTSFINHTIQNGDVHGKEHPF
jgi:hypothetical protein